MLVRRSIPLVLLLACAANGCVGGDAPEDPFDSGNAGKSGSGAAAGSGARAGSGGAGGSGSTAGLPKAGSKQSHFPLIPGSSWTYHHENPTKDPWDEIASLQAATYKGSDAFLLQDEEDAKGEQTTSTLVIDGTGVYRAYREVAVAGQVAVKTTYDPGFLRYDEALDTQGEMLELVDGWQQECITNATSNCAPGAIKPGTTTHTFKVVSTSAQVTVGAGTFDTVEIERVNVEDAELKHFWFALGIGKVRELDVGSGATEELTEYHIP